MSSVKNKNLTASRKPVALTTDDRKVLGSMLSKKREKALPASQYETRKFRTYASNWTPIVHKPSNEQVCFCLSFLRKWGVVSFQFMADAVSYLASDLCFLQIFKERRELIFNWVGLSVISIKCSSPAVVPTIKTWLNFGQILPALKIYIILSLSLQFGIWTDSQRKRFLDLIFQQCRRSQLLFIQGWFQERVPLKHVDFSKVLPKFLSLYIFSFLDPRSLCRASLVCWHWKFLAEQVTLPTSDVCQIDTEILEVEVCKFSKLR